MSNSFLNFASITKKVSMSIIGLFLAVFLIVHLGINLLLLKGDGGTAFGAASEFMGTNPVIKVFEWVLFAAFIIHIILGIALWIYNRKARPVRYVKATASETSFMSKYMIHTGIIVFIFLIIHFINFYFVKIGLVAVPEGAHGNHDFYNMAIILFQQPLYSIIYIISLLGLGFHLNHAIQSGFQSLGWNHSKYTPIVKAASTIYSLAITIGFIVIPLYFLFIF